MFKLAFKHTNINRPRSLFLNIFLGLLPISLQFFNALSIVEIFTFLQGQIIQNNSPRVQHK